MHVKILKQTAKWLCVHSREGGTSEGSKLAEMLGAVHIRLKPLLQPCRRPRKFVLIVVVSHIQAECRVLVKISVAFRDLLLQLLMPSFKVPMLLASICVVT